MLFKQNSKPGMHSVDVFRHLLSLYYILKQIFFAYFCLSGVFPKFVWLLQAISSVFLQLHIIFSCITVVPCPSGQVFYIVLVLMSEA